MGYVGDDRPNAKNTLKEVARSFHIFSLPKQNEFVPRSFYQSTAASIQARSPKLNMILGSKELAGLVHLPTIYVQTPGIAWMQARVLEPPHNLPTV